MSKTKKAAAGADPAGTVVRGNLMWSKATLTEGRVTFAKAEETVKGLDLAGFTDWRLPTIQELLTLVDYTRHDPAIDIDQFPDTEPSFYWASTPVAGDPDSAWGVHFYYGASDGWRRGNLLGFVRAVRSVSPSPGQ